METRRSRVAWDSSLIRVEHLDDKGQPYFCSFEKADDGGRGTRVQDENLADQRLSPVAGYAWVMVVVLLLSVVGTVVWMAG
jgi:hypothetical protein